MSSTFHGVSTAYSGLRASQRQVETASHNISNANNPFYTRQRAVQANQIPLDIRNGDLGQGTQIMTIKRVHDDFVYDRYRKATEEQEFSNVKKETLKEIAQYFPDMQDIGIFKDLQEYFTSWSELSSNPTSSAHKENLKSKTEVLTADLQNVRSKVQDTQMELNKQIEVMVNEVNKLIKQIAEVNVKIRAHEADKINNANDLRDERDKYELALAKILDIKVFKEGTSSDNTMIAHNADWDENYVLNVGGFTLVDETGSHSIRFNGKKNPYGFGNIEFVRDEDLAVFDMTKYIKGGKIGSMLDLRGRTMIREDGEFSDGKLQGYIDDLDTFAKGLIESTNSVYAKSSREEMRSNKLTMSPGYQITNFNKTDYNIKEGSFDLIMYDANGKEVGKKTIDVNAETTMKSLVEKINQNTDDNGDNSPHNDIDDEFEARYANGFFTITQKNKDKEYTIAFVDHKDAPTNIAGALGLNRFFDGKSAKDIALNRNLLENSEKIYASLNPHSGDSSIANDMQQLQFDNVEFMDKNGKSRDETISYYYNLVTTKIATDGDEYNSNADTKRALYNTIKGEFDSISKVSMDEELTELMKFQTAYQANAKVMNTINTILDTLLGLKQ